MKNQLSRRVFMERLCASTLGGAAVTQVLNRRAGAEDVASQGGPEPGACDAPQGTVAWTPPPLLRNPNILFIMVDQLRWPCWLNASQSSTLAQQYLPNIFGRIRNRSYVFQQYYTAATICTAARGTLLTGLYAPQTATYTNEQTTAAAALNPAFPTWGSAVAALSPAYAGNCWWFGKWHLSDCRTATPLQEYGFNTSTYPGGAADNPSPDGHPNEGADGGPFDGTVYASDAQIASDFIAWLSSQPPAAAPWCATVSLINPHDISGAPDWLQSAPFPPVGVPPAPVYFPPPAFPPATGPSALYSVVPSPWNYEDLSQSTNKPSVQYAFQTAMNRSYGKVSDWTLFLNQYYWLQYYVDRQVGRILNALGSQAGNTVIVFTSDHGEYAGSHGLHSKGRAAYEESIRVPLYVRFPGQSSCIAMNQMCSSVDFFGLICDLATGGGGFWQHGPQAYPDLAPRQSIWDFLYSNRSETRVAPTLGIPYILHTCDETSETGDVTKAHIVCLRTKADASNVAQPGAKLAIYSEWANCSTIPDSTPPDYEFYDYNPRTSNNKGEVGNDYFSQNQTTQSTIAQYLDELGNWGPPATGLIASELNAPLSGYGTDGNPLSQAQAAARQGYFNSVFGAGACQT